MAEEIVSTQEGTGAATEVAEVKLTAVEQKAMEAGWVPETEWAGDPDQWRPAKEFLDRGELFKKIEDQNRSMKDMRRALDDMKSLQAKTREVEYERALATLRSQKKQALEEGNADSVIAIDDQMDLVRTEQRNMKQEATAPDLNPDFVAWVDKNKWYEDDPGMRGYADSLGKSLASKGMNPLQVLQEVETKVKEEFKHKFTNPNRQKPGTVEGSVKSGKSTETYALSDIERQVMQRFVRTGAMTEKEYIASLKNLNGG